MFGDTFVSQGWAPSAQLFGGVDVRVFKRVYVTVDGRYLWAADDLERDVGFQQRAADLAQRLLDIGLAQRAAPRQLIENSVQPF